MDAVLAAADAVLAAADAADHQEPPAHPCPERRGLDGASLELPIAVSVLGLDRRRNQP